MTRCTELRTEWKGYENCFSPWDNIRNVRVYAPFGEKMQI